MINSSPASTQINSQLFKHQIEIFAGQYKCHHPRLNDSLMEQARKFYFLNKNPRQINNTSATHLDFIEKEKEVIYKHITDVIVLYIEALRQQIINLNARDLKKLKIDKHFHEDFETCVNFLSLFYLEGKLSDSFFKNLIPLFEELIDLLEEKFPANSDFLNLFRINLVKTVTVACCDLLASNMLDYYSFFMHQLTLIPLHRYQKEITFYKHQFLKNMFTLDFHSKNLVHMANLLKEMLKNDDINVFLTNNCETMAKKFMACDDDMNSAFWLNKFIRFYHKLNEKLAIAKENHSLAFKQHTLFNTNKSQVNLFKWEQDLSMYQGYLASLSSSERVKDYQDKYSYHLNRHYQKISTYLSSCEKIEFKTYSIQNELYVSITCAQALLQKVMTKFKLSQDVKYQVKNNQLIIHPLHLLSLDELKKLIKLIELDAKNNLACPLNLQTPLDEIAAMKPVSTLIQFKAYEKNHVVKNHPKIKTKAPICKKESLNLAPVFRNQAHKYNFDETLFHDSDEFYPIRFSPFGKLFLMVWGNDIKNCELASAIEMDRFKRCFMEAHFVPETGQSGFKRQGQQHKKPGEHRMVLCKINKSCLRMYARMATKNLDKATRNLNENAFAYRFGVIVDSKAGDFDFSLLNKQGLKLTKLKAK